jgi:cell fate regulator YaaT (PSP1 superfamily)
VTDDADDGPDDPPAAPGEAPRPRRRRRRRGRGGAEASPNPSPNPSPSPNPNPGPRPNPNPRPNRNPNPRPQPDRRAQQQPQRQPQPQQPHRAPPDDGDDVAPEPLIRDPFAAPGGVDPAALRVPPAADDDDDSVPAPSEAWGVDDGSPAPAIHLAADLPSDAPADDLDPVTFPLVDGPGAQLGDDVASVVGARFVPAGRISWFDAGDGDFAPGERVLVDSERGSRLAWIATAPQRKAVRDRNLRRVIRRASEQDLRGERDESGRAHALRISKDKATALRLPLKVFRVEVGGGKVLVYYTSDDRIDVREFVSGVAQALGMRVELRQLGVRDEAKAVGGIGTCGLTLCCTTWLPEFVPVSIKMAKDQGLVLSPTKVSGQCGRLKCCLVYEQAAYAELRKGLPKLGKRVISARGEGRVVEVDVLRQRVRVSYGAGDTEVVLAADVKPLFPAGNQPREQRHDDGGDDTSDDPPDPSAA